MVSSLKSRIEKFFKDELDARIDNIPVFVDQRDLSVDVQGSYIVVTVKNMDSVYNNHGVYYADLQIWLFTNIHDATSEEHNQTLQAIDFAIDSSYCQGFKRDVPAGCRVFGWGPKQFEVDQHDQTWGDLIMLRGGFGQLPENQIPSYPEVDGDLEEEYQLKMIHRDYKKIDASESRLRITIPANSITHSALIMNADENNPFKMTYNGEVLEPGEGVKEHQTILPGENLGVSPEIVLEFDQGAKGTVTYKADRNLGPILVEAIS